MMLQSRAPPSPIGHTYSQPRPYGVANATSASHEEIAAFVRAKPPLFHHAYGQPAHVKNHQKDC